MNRRQALLVIAAGSVGSACSGRAEQDVIPSGRPTVATSDGPRELAIGSGDRIRGVCLGPAVEDFRGDSAWTGLWQRWDWEGRIRNELDDAVAVGANCVRLIGNTHAVTSNVISRDLYLSRWQQFLDHCSGAGLLVYPCGGDLRHWGETPLPIAEDIYRDWAGLLARYDGVVGVDITNESPAASRIQGGVAFHQSESWLYTVRRLGEVVREVTDKAITHSRGLYKYDAASWLHGSPETDVLSDFIDVHAYRASTPAEADALYASDWAANKQLLIGEFGANMTATVFERAAAYQEVKALIEHDPRCVGGLAWTIYDTGTDPESMYGLYDENRQPRQDIADVFATFPTTR